MYMNQGFIQDFSVGGKEVHGHCHSVMHKYAAHVLVWMQAGDLGALPQEIFLDLRCNLRPGSDYFEKSSNPILDIILTDGLWYCKLSNCVT